MSRSIWSAIREKLLGFKNAILSALKKTFILVENASKFRVALGGILLLFYIIYLSVSSPEIVVFVDQFNLSEDDTKNGYSQKVFTEQVVDIAKSNIIKTIDNDYFEKIENNKQFFKTEISNCHINDITLKETSKHVLEKLSSYVADKLHQSTKTNWGSSDINIPEYGIYIRDIFSQIFSKRVTIGGDIVKQKDETYLIQVSAKFSDTYHMYSSEYKAKDITEAKVKAAEAILKYSNPIIFALDNIDNPKEAEDAINIAKLNYYSDDKKLTSLLDTLVGFILLYNQEYTSTTEIIASRSGYYFKQAMNKDKNNSLAMMGDILISAYIFNGLDKNMVKNLKEKIENDLNQKIKSLFLSIKSDNKMLAYNYLMLTNVYDLMDKKEKIDDAWLSMIRSLEKILGDEKYNEDVLNLLFSAALYKINQKDYETANLFLERMYTYNLYRVSDAEDDKRLLNSISNRLGSHYNLGKAILVFDETENIEKIKNFIVLLKLDRNPCAIGALAKFLSDRADKNQDLNTSSALLEESNILFKHAEKNGLRGFHFYNNWAILLADLNKLEQAEEKFTKALNYNGIRSWALLNFGSRLNKIGRYKEAENKFRESLESGITQNGVGGYLYSIYKQKDYQRFLEEYNTYDIYIDTNDEMTLFVGFSYCMIQNQEKAEKFLLQIESMDKISNDDREALRDCINQIKLNKP